LNKNLIKLKDAIESSSYFQRLIKKYRKFDSVSINQLIGSSKSIFVNSFSENENKPIIILCPDNLSAIEWLNDLNIFTNKNKISYLVEPIKYTKVNFEKEDEILGWLIEGLSKLIEQENPIIITTPEIFSIKIPDANQVIKNKITLRKEMTLDFNRFTTDLILEGFERNDYVGQEGEVAIRGGIVDIFPTGFDNPLRVEFWGDEIESIREFDALSQRSIKEFDSIEFIAKLFHESNTEANTSIYDYISEETVLFVDNPELIKNKYENFELEHKLKEIIINSINKSDIKANTKSQINFNSSVKTFSKYVLDEIENNNEVIITAEDKNHLERIRSLFRLSLENEFKMMDQDEISFIISKINWVDNTVSNGFIFDDTISILTEHQIFERQRILDRKQGKKTPGISLKELNELRMGDFVVHDDKGVARFEGFRTIKMGGSEQDCIQLSFADNDLMYINMNYIHKIQKFSAQEGNIPKLSKLGSTEWIRKKARTKKKIKDIARDLIKLYAERKMQKGFQYPEDTAWQKEFEASFIYDDTKDQARTTDEIKVDMESINPMDRLVCGDVGFGKTEIAIRAAFKAVQAGKQVAILVPTTILAQQHYMSFRDRLDRYPVNIDVLSRFKSKKLQSETLKELRAGLVDIIIGTHRILSKDIEFKNLGLLIIDEEQRFGVAAKEKLRKMKSNIDTLTLTATPIPRTLNFSLMGARDLSVIETPPRNRLPIFTEILERDDDKIVKVIDNELSRNGQVFFVTDKVKEIDRLLRDLQILMPKYIFGVAHGQMPPKDIEKIMQNFISGKIDVLVTTKIVESGLDIPNANTIIINNAQNFGLAELYQLRGRVGRTTIQAYCNLIIPPANKVSKDAIKRLQAIEEFTDLGSGFQLALKDMEIRGAGNLLGGEQSGVIFDIGFELYQKVLDEAVKELKADEFGNIFDEEGSKLKLIENKEVAVEIDADAILPSEYIHTDTERFAYYKKLHAVRKLKELNEIKDELIDKYGRLPKKAENLLFVIQLRIASITSGFERIIVKPRKLFLEFPNKSKEDFYKNAFPLIMEYIQEIEGGKLNQMKNKLTWECPIKNRSASVEILHKIKKTVEFIDYD